MRGGGTGGGEGRRGEGRRFRKGEGREAQEGEWGMQGDTDWGLSVISCSKYIDKLDGQTMRCIEELCNLRKSMIS